MLHFTNCRVLFLFFRGGERSCSGIEFAMSSVSDVLPTVAYVQEALRLSELLSVRRDARWLMTRGRLAEGYLEASVPKGPR